MMNMLKIPVGTLVEFEAAADGHPVTGRAEKPPEGPRRMMRGCVVDSGHPSILTVEFTQDEGDLRQWHWPDRGHPQYDPQQWQNPAFPRIIKESLESMESLKMRFKQEQARLIHRSLVAANWNVSRTSKLLCTSVANLHATLKRAKEGTYLHQLWQCCRDHGPKQGRR